MGDGASRLYLKNILSSLSSSFTDVKNAISGVSTKVDSVGTKVDNASTSIDTSLSSYNKFVRGGLPIVSNLTEQKTKISYTTKQSPLTAISVTGKGFLNAAIVYATSGFGADLEVIIDGKKLKFHAKGNTSVSGVFNKYHALGIVNTSSGNLVCFPDGVLVYMGIRNISGANGVVSDPMLSKSHLASGHTFKDDAICVSDGYIRFEKSLVVKQYCAEQDGRDTYAYISYFLAD